MTTSSPLTDTDQERFDAIAAAFRHPTARLGLVRATMDETGKEVAVIVYIDEDDDKYTLIPLAIICDDIPLTPAIPKGEE